MSSPVPTTTGSTTRRKSDDERHERIVHCRLRNDEHQLLAELAQRRGLSMAGYLRHMLAIGARSAGIVDQSRRAEARRRRQQELLLASPEGQRLIAQRKRLISVRLVQDMLESIRNQR